MPGRYEGWRVRPMLDAASGRRIPSVFTTAAVPEKILVQDQ